MTTELSANGPRVASVRGQLVMLAAEVAHAFGVETRQVVQNIKNNPVKLPMAAAGAPGAILGGIGRADAAVVGLLPEFIAPARALPPPDKT